MTHTFTHFQLELQVYLALNVAAETHSQGCAWYPRAALRDEALPSVMRKVLAHAIRKAGTSDRKLRNSRSCRDGRPLSHTTHPVAAAFGQRPVLRELRQ